MFIVFNLFTYEKSVGIMERGKIIFDIDGTLLNATGCSAKGFNRVYEMFEVNKRITAEFIEKNICGKPASEYNHLLLDGVPESEHEKVLTLFDQFELEEVEKADAVQLFYPDVLDNLYKLKRCYDLFIVSNCGSLYLQAVMHKINDPSLFIDVECNGNTHLPKSENILAILKRNKCSLSNTYYIGDTAGDKKASEEAGVKFCHVTYGFEPKLLEEEQGGDVKAVYPLERKRSYGFDSFNSFKELTESFEQLARKREIPISV